MGFRVWRFGLRVRSLGVKGLEMSGGAETCVGVSRFLGRRESEATAFLAGFGGSGL